MYHTAPVEEVDIRDVVWFFCEKIRIGIYVIEDSVSGRSWKKDKKIVEQVVQCQTVKVLAWDLMKHFTVLTNEGVSEADGLGGNGLPEAPPICWNDGWLADETVYGVDELSWVALDVFAGHVGDIVTADSSSLSLRRHRKLVITGFLG